MDQRTCSVPECNKQTKARGWCNPHYQRALRYGDPLPAPYAPEPNPCAFCGGGMPDRRPNGNVRKYCTPQCRKAAYAVKAAESCIANSEQRKAERAARTLARRAAVDRQCIRCHEPIPKVSMLSAKYCSKTCSRAATRATWSRECSKSDYYLPVRAKGLCSTHYHNKYLPDRHGVVEVECACCGKSIMRGKSNNKTRKPYCSNECRARMLYSASRSLKQLVGPIDAPLPLRPPRSTVAPVFEVKNPRRIITSGKCADCGDQFVGVSFNAKSLARYCSKQCMRRAGKRAHGQFAVSPKFRAAIYERDLWTCQLCLDPVDQNLHINDIWAATLDHIIPQSKGGLHGADNLRLAHRWCNSVRCDDSHYTAADLAPPALTV